MITDMKHVPTKPGVYQFFNDKEIIYIGKAKNLNKRVRSYFTHAIKDRKTDQIKKQAIKVETFTTHTEAEALILEQQLIKEHKPKFNILLRDDKTFPFIFFDSKHVYPSIHLKRSKHAVSGDYYGPFTSAKLVRDQLKELQKIFKIRNCADSTFANRSRPCIEYQMKRCSAPCANLISQSDYLQEVERAKKYLVSERKQIKKVFQQQMNKHSNKLEFEEADELKKRILAINALEDESNLASNQITLDILHFMLEHSKTGIAVLAVREGRLQSTKTYFIDEGIRDDIENLIQGTIFQYYQSVNQLPKKILILNKIQNPNLISKALSQKFLKEVKVILNTPRHAYSYAALAKLNSKQAITNYSTKDLFYKDHFNELRKAFKITISDLTLECLDISHHSGTNARAGIAHFNASGPNKSKYRTYKIPRDLAGNDVGAIKFAVEKRLHIKNTPPAVLLIDGGEMQLKAAISAKNHTRTTILAIKKGSKRKLLTETVYSQQGQEDIKIDSKLFRLLLKARDEAHRFSLKANHAAKLKSIRISKLDTIHGLGPKKITMLLNK